MQWRQIIGLTLALTEEGKQKTNHSLHTHYVIKHTELIIYHFLPALLPSAYFKISKPGQARVEQQTMAYRILLSIIAQWHSTHTTSLWCAVWGRIYFYENTFLSLTSWNLILYMKELIHKEATSNSALWFLCGRLSKDHIKKHETQHGCQILGTVILQYATPLLQCTAY